MMRVLFSWFVSMMTCALLTRALFAQSPTHAVTPAVMPARVPTVPAGSAGAASATGSLLPAKKVSRVPRKPNPVVVPSYRARIRAAHRVHAEQTQLLCEDCHERAKSSTLTQDWLGPLALTCEKCHSIRHAEHWGESPTAEICLSCHVDTQAPQNALASDRPLERHASARLHFSHAKHAIRRIDCQQCHGNVKKMPDALGSERLPRKPTCLRCHRGEGRWDGEARATCITCHEADAGRMRTRFGVERLVPTEASLAMEHSADFRQTHRFVAANQGRNCEGCHTERECQSCHDGRLRPRDIHPADWHSAHAIAAKQGENCSSCHRLQSFCLSCHQRVGIVSSGAPRALSARGNVHPPASIWTTGPRGANHHGVAAKRNLTECVSCHQERDCIRCHAVGSSILGQSTPYGAGLNPHPPTFASQCRGYFARNPRPCLACHRPDGSEIQRCR